MDVLRSMCCWLCLQAEGGKRAGAVATVVSAVDLARVRQPVHVEGGRAEEEDADAVEAELRQQAAAAATATATAVMAVDQQYRASRTRVQAGRVLTTAQVTPESTLPLPQVSQASTAKPLNYQVNSVGLNPLC